MKFHIFGGGTVSHVRPHMALCAPAYGGAAREIYNLISSLVISGDHVQLYLTRMAGSAAPNAPETNQDIADILQEKVLKDLTSSIVFMSAALCDFDGSVTDGGPVDHDRPVLATLFKTPSGKQEPRLKTSEGDQLMILTPAEKVIGMIRKTRKDIFLVGFKTTAGATEDEQFEAGLNLVKGASCNLVLANDVHTRLNMIVTPEQARYHVTGDRKAVLRNLVEMALARSQGRFTRSTVVEGEKVPWADERVPNALRVVVDHCREAGAYKPFRGSTVGHFAVKLGDNEFLTSVRGDNYNNLHLEGGGLVRVEADGDDRVIAHGHKPSVGGQSQRIIFREHPGTDCIVHAHVQLKAGSKVPVRKQREHECGSHECGQNTSDGLKDFDGIRAVMLENHGPNIVFSQGIDPERVTKFIDENFELDRSTSERAQSSA